MADVKYVDQEVKISSHLLINGNEGEKRLPIGNLEFCRLILSFYPGRGNPCFSLKRVLGFKVLRQESPPVNR